MIRSTRNQWLTFWYARARIRARLVRAQQQVTNLDAGAAPHARADQGAIEPAKCDGNGYPRAADVSTRGRSQAA